jgi:gliding motility-associated lipoprotein GldD
MKAFANFMLLFSLFYLVACGEEGGKMPKQRLFPYVEYPVRMDTTFDHSICPFTFQYPNYLNYRQDSFYFGEKPLNDCWFDLNSQQLGASIHCSYYPITSRARFDELVDDAFIITGKHNIRANARRESVISGRAGVGGILFEVSGPVASPVQFFLTDSTHHFFRGSLYFNATVNPDSTAPVLAFMRKDLETILNTFEWKK